MNHLWVILLHISQLSMAVSAYRDLQRRVEMLAGYVVPVETAIVTLAAARAD
jgi:hypothetical protein